MPFSRLSGLWTRDMLSVVVAMKEGEEETKTYCEPRWQLEVEIVFKDCKRDCLGREL